MKLIFNFFVELHRAATRKVGFGLLLKGAGYALNNQGLKDGGAGLIGKGLLTGGVAHLFPNGK